MNKAGRYQHGGIAGQFFRAALLNAIIAIVLLTIGASLVGAHFLRQQQFNHVDSVASLMAVQAQAAVLFEDELNANEVIESLASGGDIQIAELRLSSGRVLAYYESPGSGLQSLVDRAIRRVEVKRDIVVEDRAIGSLMLIASNATLTGAMLGLFLSDLVVSLLCVLLSIWLAARYARRVAVPLGKLHDAMGRMIHNADYTARVPSFDVQELDELRGQFNELLARLESRDRELLDANATLAQLAFSDALTGLPNRAMFERTRLEVIRSARERGSRLGMLYLDLDGFKRINDTYGHEVGDCFLRELARRLAEWRPDEATAARRGGDEFIVLLPEPPQHAEMNGVVDRLRALLETPMVIGTHTLKPKVSVGWAIYPDTTDSLDDLTAAADEAMYANKSQRQIPSHSMVHG